MLVDFSLTERHRNEASDFSPPSSGLFWFGVFLIVLAHLPFWGMALVYSFRTYGWEHVFAFGLTMSGMMHLGTILSIKWSIYTAAEVVTLSTLTVDSPAGVSASTSTTTRSYEGSLASFADREVYGLTVYQWRTLSLFFLCVNFCHLLLACLLNGERRTDRVYHALIVFGNWFLFVDHGNGKAGTTTSSGASNSNAAAGDNSTSLSVRYVPVMLFGLFVVVKKLVCPEGHRRKVENDNSAWFNARAPMWSVLLWFVSAVVNLFAAFLEDRSVSFLMPWYLLWLFSTGMAFLLTCKLVCHDHKKLRPARGGCRGWIKDSLVAKCVRALCPKFVQRRGEAGGWL
eukprot:g9444.t1